jgi:hypothetical protein
LGKTHLGKLEAIKSPGKGKGRLDTWKEKPSKVKKKTGEETLYAARLEAFTVYSIFTVVSVSG